MAYTENGIFIPKGKIAVASSFEGIVNDGCPECFLTSINAYSGMEEGKGKFYNKVIEPEDFGEARKGREMKAFRRLRPIVELAEDYVTILETIHSNPELIEELLNDPDNWEIYEPILEKFFHRRAESDDLRARFKEEFYDERKRMQDRDFREWVKTQGPFEGMIPQYKLLVETQKKNDDPDPYSSIESGFVPWFATSKDEASTFSLCSFYAAVGLIDEEDVGSEDSDMCVIKRDRIIGKERTRDKIEQLKMIADKEGVPRSNVWRLNDRYDKDQQLRLRDEGFPYQFLIKGGYAFPHDVAAADEDSFIIVMERDEFAKRLSQYAEKWGF